MKLSNLLAVSLMSLISMLAHAQSGTAANITGLWRKGMSDSLFFIQPDSMRVGGDGGLRTIARQAHLREVIVPVGQERPVLVMTDMAVLAARYPSVAANLKASGLTAPQHDAYRVALASARTTETLSGAAGAVSPNSVLAKNVAFMKAHPDVFMALEITTNGLVRYQGPDNMWVFP